MALAEAYLVFLFAILGAFIKAETFAINHSYYDPFVYKVSNRNSKISFSVTPEGMTAVNYFHALKMGYLNSNRLWERTLLEPISTLKLIYR